MFLRDVGTLSPDEHILYNYWLITLALLEIGIPWATFQEFTSDEIAIILAVDMAKKEKQSEQEATQYKMTQQKVTMNRR